MLDKYEHSGALQALKFNSLLIRKKNINTGLVPYAIKQASYLFITQLYISTV